MKFEGRSLKGEHLQEAVPDGSATVRYQPYPEYKESNIPWLNELPKHWVGTHFKRYCDIQLGKMLQPNPASDHDKQIPYLRAVNVQWGQIDTSNIHEMWASPKDIEKFIVKNGDLLVCEGGEVGRSAILKNLTGTCIIQNALHRIKGNAKTNVPFLHYLMRHIADSKWFDILCNKATIAHLTSEKLGAIDLPLPPCSEQQTIAAFLDYKTARIDALIAKKKALLEKLAEKRTALISHAVTKGLDPKAPMRDSGIDWLGEIPAHWEVKKLKYFASNENGIGIQIGPFGGMLKDLTYDDDGEFKVYGQENTLSGDFYKGRRWITKTQFELLSNYQALPGDILFTRKGSIGGCTILPQGIQKGIIDSDTIRLRINSAVMVPLFLLYAFKFSTYFHAQVQRIKRGAILSGLNTATIANLIVIAPPPSEQNEITDFFEQETMVLDLLMKKNESAVARLQEYRSALITNAVTGKIDVRSFRFPEDHITGEADAQRN